MAFVNGYETPWMTGRACIMSMMVVILNPLGNVHVDERAVHGIVPSCTVRRGRTGVVHCGFHSRRTDRAVIARPRVADALRFAAATRPQRLVGDAIHVRAASRARADEHDDHVCDSPGERKRPMGSTACVPTARFPSMITSMIT